MIYFVTALEDSSPFGRWGRRYCRALMEAREDVRFIPLTRNHCIMAEDVDPVDRIIAARFGGGPGEVEATIYHGSPEALASRAFEEAPGPLGIALTVLLGPLGDEEIAGLKRYREVWVPREEDAGRLQAGGLRRVRVVPTPTFEDDKVAPVENGEHVVYTLGMWAEAERIFNHYLKGGYAPATLLHLACPDTPILSRQELEEYVGKVALDIPAVSFQPKAFHQYRSREIQELHAAGDRYVPCASAYDFWHLGAYMAGNVPLAPGHPVTLEANAQVALMLEHIAALQSTPIAVARKRSVGVVIPHKNRGRTALEAVLESVQDQLAPDDVVVISDQGSSVECLESLVQLTVSQGLTLATSEPPECGWSLAAARNAGARAALNLQVDTLFFLDADVLLPANALVLLTAELELVSAATMMVVDGERAYLPGEVKFSRKSWSGSAPGRPATGCPMVRAEDFMEAGAYDPGFEGWGSEDIDLLRRLDSHAEVRAVVAYHQPHEVSPYKASHGETNRLELAALSGLSCGLEEDWGQHQIIVLQGMGL